VTITPIPFGQVMRQAETAQSMEVAGEMARRRQEFMTTASERRSAQALTGREEELADGFAEMRFASNVIVSAHDGKEPERASGEIEHGAGRRGWSSRGCAGSRRQRSPTLCSYVGDSSRSLTGRPSRNAGAMQLMRHGHWHETSPLDY
jgi:hypothetical protein